MLLRPLLASAAVLIAAACMEPTAMAQLLAGTARISITPMEEGIPTQLGGYGDRAGAPATAIHDTLYAKIIVFEYQNKKSALLGLDVCHLPKALVDESLRKADLPGLTYDTVLMAASHSHTGLEGFSMDPRNFANNPHVGIFQQAILDFVSDRIAKGLRQAAAQLRPVTVGAAAATLPGFNRNRRHDNAPTDETMTVLRFDTDDGKPYAVLVNYTAHGTIVGPEDMWISGEWAGVMQRTLEDLIGNNLTALYTNGSEGDVAPRGYSGGSHYEMAEQYGRRIALRAAELTRAIATRPVTQFSLHQRWAELPPRKAAPDFAKIAGDEYKVDASMVDAMLNAMFPDRAPLYLLRINDFAMITFPGEPITAIGMAAKDALRQAGIQYHTVAALTNDLIGYILTADEYHQSGYEVTASFYGDTLGQIMLDNARALIRESLTPTP